MLTSKQTFVPHARAIAVAEMLEIIRPVCSDRSVMVAGGLSSWMVDKGEMLITSGALRTDKEQLEIQIRVLFGYIESQISRTVSNGW